MCVLSLNHSGLKSAPPRIESPIHNEYHRLDISSKMPCSAKVSRGKEHASLHRFQVLMNIWSKPPWLWSIESRHFYASIQSGLAFLSLGSLPSLSFCYWKQKTENRKVGNWFSPVIDIVLKWFLFLQYFHRQRILFLLRPAWSRLHALFVVRCSTLKSIAVLLSPQSSPLWSQSGTTVAMLSYGFWTNCHTAFELFYSEY